MTYFLVAELEVFMGEGFKAKLIKYNKKKKYLSKMIHYVSISDIVNYTSK